MIGFSTATIAGMVVMTDWMMPGRVFMKPDPARVVPRVDWICIYPAVRRLSYIAREELVRYLHLNPLRAAIVADIKEQDNYPFCGHADIMGKVKKKWQDDAYVLELFNNKKSTARRRYKIFVQKGIQEGKRSELTGGGLIRSSGGWSVVKSLRRGNIHVKSDERVLGDSDLFERVLQAADESLERKHQLKSQGYDINRLADRVAAIYSIKPEEIYQPGKQPIKVKARSLFCYWAVRELGFTMADLAPKLSISQPAVSISARRGEKIASENGYLLLHE